ncbi:MAG: GAF and ANTAR domain-containing protein [Streptosporangiales bacterium]
MSDLEDIVSSVPALRAVVNAALGEREGALSPLVRVGRACAELLPVDGASISVMAGTDHRETLYAGDAVIERVEELQFSLGEGPCFEAFDTGRPVLVPDLAEASGAAWPVFASQTSDEPIGAIFAFPLQVGVARIGAIDMYRRAPGWLRPADLATALQVADIATATLTGLQAAGPDGTLDEEWLTALPHNREAVHQATGMVIAAFEIPAAQALARLRGYAFTTGRLVDEVAADLVTRRLHPSDIDT